MGDDKTFEKTIYIRKVLGEGREGKGILQGGTLVLHREAERGVYDIRK